MKFFKGSPVLQNAYGTARFVLDHCQGASLKARASLINGGARLQLARSKTFDLSIFLNRHENCSKGRKVKLTSLLCCKCAHL